MKRLSGILKRLSMLPKRDGADAGPRPRVRKGKRKGKGKGVVTEKSVSIHLPQFLPDELLNYTWDHAVTYVQYKNMI